MSTLSVTRSIEIDAPADEVFAFLTDPVRTMRAQSPRGSVVVSDLMTTPEGWLVSYRWSERFGHVPIALKARVTVLDCDPPRRLVERHSTGPVETYVLEPVGDGTRLTYTAELSRWVAALARAQERFATKGKGAEADMDEYLARIKAQVQIGRPLMGRRT